MTKTIKLFNSEGAALTRITSSDASMTLPTEIGIDSDGMAIARHANEGDFEFDSLEALCAAYGISIEVVMAECDTVDHNGEKLGERKDVQRKVLALSPMSRSRDLWDELWRLIEASGARVTFDSERDITKPCWCCGRADVPRELVQIGHYLNPHRDSMARPVCAGCSAQLAASNEVEKSATTVDDTDVEG